MSCERWWTKELWRGVEGNIPGRKKEKKSGDGGKRGGRGTRLVERLTCKILETAKNVYGKDEKKMTSEGKGNRVTNVGVSGINFLNQKGEKSRAT